jgi:uncharacterized protein YjbI with pentapeptide repeats
MANEAHLARLKPGVAAWNPWREANRDITPDLIQADLPEAHLNGAYLDGANLREAHLQRADLRGHTHEAKRITR